MEVPEHWAGTQEAQRLRKGKPVMFHFLWSTASQDSLEEEQGDLTSCHNLLLKCCGFWGTPVLVQTDVSPSI